MALSSGVKFRCYPAGEQARILASWMNCQRYIYNAKVGEERYFMKYRDNALSLTGGISPLTCGTRASKTGASPRISTKCRPRF